MNFPPEVEDIFWPICPKCNERAEKTETKYGIRFSCEGCSLWSWGYAPLVSAQTHAYRKKAHDAFDSLWREEHMTRTEAYAILSEKMGIEKTHCHIRNFSVHQCKQVISIAELLLGK